MTWTPPPARPGRYDSPPPWRPDGKQCSHGPGCPGSEPKTEEAQALIRAIRQEFGDRIARIGGYCCRPNTANRSQTSVHGTGRAIDVYPVSMVDGAAIADYLAGAEHGEGLGVQYVIWDHSFWGAGKSGRYTGPDPHTDHVHAEVRRRPSRVATAAAAGGGGLLIAGLIFLALSDGGLFHG